MYVKIEEDILFNEDLTFQEKGIVSLVRSMGNLLISNEKIGKMLGVSASRASAILTKLARKGYIIVNCKCKKGANTERTITLGKMVKAVSEVVKEAVKEVAAKAVSKVKKGSKAKELKSDYVPVAQQVGTHQVQKQSFGNKFYKKPDKKARFNNIASHNFDFDVLEAMEQQYIEDRSKPFSLEDAQNRLNNARRNR